MPETTENFHHVPIASCKITATIGISKERGIKARYCGGEKKIATYLFDTDRWSMESAREWVKARSTHAESELFDPFGGMTLAQIIEDMMYKRMVKYEREKYGPLDGWRKVAESEMQIGKKKEVDSTSTICKCSECSYEGDEEADTLCSEANCPECGATLGKKPPSEERESITPTYLSLSLPAAERVASGDLSRIIHMGDLEEVVSHPVHITHEGRVHAVVILSQPVSIGSDVYAYEVEVIEAYSPPLELFNTYCKHQFFKCQVPAGDSCVAIYHDVCMECRWDLKKGCTMPDNIWQGWAVPQLLKRDSKESQDVKEPVLESALIERVSWRLPPFSSEGGNYFLAPTIRDLFPPHETFVEVYCGASNVLFSTYPVSTEVLNDTDIEFISAYESMRALTLRQLIELRGKNWHPWKAKFESLKGFISEDEVNQLYRFLYLSWYSFDSNRKDYRGRPKNWSLEARLGRVENARVRLREVKLTSEDGISCIERWDSPSTAFFLDPPFTQENNIDPLRETLSAIEGKFVLRISDTPEHRDTLSEYNVMSTSVVRRAGRVVPNEGEGIIRERRAELLVTNCDLPSELEKGSI